MIKKLEKYYDELSDEFFGIGDFDMLKLAAYERRTDVLEQIAIALRSNKPLDIQESDISELINN